MSGNTFRAYLQVLRHGPCELREVQHALNMSTPSLASYHLGKLVESGYVRQDDRGAYVAAKDSVGDVLEGYSKIGKAIIPQFAFFAIFFSIVIAYFSFQALYHPVYTPYLAVVSLAAAAALWFETLRLWRRISDWR